MGTRLNDKGEYPDLLIVGLGNPGSRYDNTRHNVGFRAIDYIERHAMLGSGCKRMLHTALTDRVVIDGYLIHLLKPQTYMNNSGIAVSSFIDYYRFPKDRILVICDDVTIPLGHIRIRKNGSSGGHNGIKSIIDHVGDGEFARIRIGVGQKPEKWDLASYVLSKFNEHEERVIDHQLRYVRDAISCMLNYDIERAMSYYNTANSRSLLDEIK